MSVRGVVMTVVVGAWFAACAGDTTIGAGGNADHPSGWLSVCRSNADCSGELGCWCGVCTKGCTETSDCAKLSKNAACDPGLAQTICSGMPDRIACLLPCKTDGDCKEVGGENRCFQGVCSPYSDRDGGSSICERARREATDRAFTTLASLDKSCLHDSDCVAGAGLVCGLAYGCSNTYPPVSKAARAAAEAELAAAEKEICEPFFAAGCFRGVSFGCLDEAPVCVSGTCGWAGGAIITVGELDAGAPLTCDDRVSALDQRVAAHMDKADRTCAADTDCTIAYLDLRCLHGCGSFPLSRAGAAALLVEWKMIEADYCPFLEAAGCVATVPSCPGELPYACVGGICDYWPTRP